MDKENISECNDSTDSNSLPVDQHKLQAHGLSVKPTPATLKEKAKFLRLKDKVLPQSSARSSSGGSDLKRKLGQYSAEGALQQCSGDAQQQQQQQQPSFRTSRTYISAESTGEGSERGDELLSMCSSSPQRRSPPRNQHSSGSASPPPACEQEGQQG